MNDNENTLNEEHQLQHRCDKRHEVVVSTLEEIRNEISRISLKLDSRPPFLPQGARDAYPQEPRSLVGPLGDNPDTLDVVLAHFIPQRLREDIAFFQVVTMRYLKAHGGDPMLAKRAGHLYAGAHGFFNRRASTHLVTQANIEGDVFWVPDPANHQIWFALVIDASNETPANLRARIKPQIKEQFTVESFGPKFVLSFENERDFIIAKMHLK